MYGYTWPDRNDEDENWFEIYDYDGNLVQKIDLYPHDEIDIISADKINFFEFISCSSQKLSIKFSIIKNTLFIKYSNYIKIHS